MGWAACRAAQSADAMLTTVVEHVKRGTSSLEKVLFVLYEDQAQKAFSEVLKRLGGSSLAFISRTGATPGVGSLPGSPPDALPGPSANRRLRNTTLG